MNKKNESSAMAGGNIAGVQGGGGFPLVKRKSPLESSENFEDLVNYCLLNDMDIEEVVKKRGSNWVVFDDKTGVEKGSYPTRSDAWAKQRQFRQSNKNEKKRKYKKHNRPHSDGAKTAPKAKTGSKAKAAPKAKLAPKPKVEKENFLRVLKQKFTEAIIKEASSLSYVFEQSPLDNDTVTWENFLQKLSRQALMSDEKLKNILRNVAKAEIKILGSSVAAIKQVLESTGQFEVAQGKSDQDSEGNLFLAFMVTVPEAKKKIPFAVKVENGRPLIHFPDQARAELNSMVGEEGKLLRAELMHIQETVLDKIEDLSSATEKRNAYLKGMESQMDRILKNMDSLEIAMLKHVIKSKYKGVK